jgi:hypothetical protein
LVSAVQLQLLVRPMSQRVVRVVESAPTGEQVHEGSGLERPRECRHPRKRMSLSCGRSEAVVMMIESLGRDLFPRRRAWALEGWL